MPCRKCLVAGSLSMVLAVAAGAIGAHLINSRLVKQVEEGSIGETERMDIRHSWDVAVRTHAVHSLGLLLLGLASVSCPEVTCRRVAFLMILGILLFSGVIYLVTVAKVAGTNLPGIHYLIPLGGISWMVGWGMLAVGFSRGMAGNDEPS